MDNERQGAFLDTLGGFLDDDGPLPGARHLGGRRR